MAKCIFQSGVENMNANVQESLGERKNPGVWWCGAHLLPQIQMRVPDKRWEDTFRRSYPAFRPKVDAESSIAADTRILPLSFQWRPISGDILLVKGIATASDMLLPLKLSGAWKNSSLAFCRFQLLSIACTALQFRRLQRLLRCRGCAPC